MLSPKDVHKGIDLLFHIWILFTFLIIFFMFLHRKDDSVKKELTSVINDNVPDFLNSIDKLDQRLGSSIDWNGVNNMAKNIQKKYNSSDQKIDTHNKTLLRNSIFVSVSILILLIGTVIYFVHFKNMEIVLGKIILNNFVIIVIVGVLETLFFMNIKLKYSSVTKFDIINNFIDRTEYHIDKN